MSLEALKGKIDSAEAYAKVAEGLYIPATCWTEFGKNYKLPWWALRETLRVNHGIYKSTEVLDKVREDFPHIFAHVSIDDPQYVAYTPDAEAGRRDKQIKLSLGRLLMKLYPTLPDHIIQEEVAEHLGDINNEVEFISGEDIAKSYDEAAVTSCMANKTWVTGFHACLMYDAPNIRMAVLRDKSGKINARCMVYEPSENDKRAIRFYGDPKLKRRLTNLGYKIGSWIGAKFRLIKLDDETADGIKFVAPYLDCNGGPGSYDGSSVAILDGELVCVTRRQRDLITKAVGSNYVTLCGSTVGYNYVKPMSSEQFYVTCCLTGDRFSILEEEGVEIMMPDLTIQRARSIPETYRSARVRHQSMWATYYIHPDVPTFEYMHSKYVEMPEARAALNMFTLDQAYYPSTVYGSRHDSVSGLTGRLLREDSVVLIRDNGDKTYAHKSLVNKKWVKLHATTRSELVYSESSIGVLKTNTGRKVHQSYHSVVRTIQGTVMFRRNAKMFTVMGETFFSEGLVSANDRSAFSAHVQEALRENVTNSGQTPYMFGLYQLANNFGYGTLLDGVRVYGLSSLEEKLKTEGAQSLLMRFFDATTGSVKMVFKPYLVAISTLCAEAEAVEAPHYLTTPVDPTSAVEIPVVATEEEIAELV